MFTNRLGRWFLIPGSLLLATACGSDDDSGDGAGGSAGAGATGGSSSGGAGGGGGAAATGGSSSGGAGGSGGATATGGSGGAAAGGAGATVCARPEGMPAVTLTYDDALRTQLTTAAPSLKAHGLTATFFLTNVSSNPEPWAALRADGHELAAHTFKHPCPKVNTWVAPGNANEDYDLTRMAAELDEGIALLQDLGEQPPYTFAYPCGIDWVGEAHESYVPLIQERFAAARGVSPGLVQSGVDLWHVPTTFSTGDGAALIAIAERARTAGAWVVFGFHGIGGDTNSIDATAHEELLTYLDEQRSSIYVATFRELAACFQP